MSGSWTDEVAKLYLSSRHGACGLRLDRKLEELLRSYCTKKRVIDLGCGTGRFMEDVLSYGATSVFGVDNSPKMVDLAGETLDRCDPTRVRSDVSVGDICSLPSPTNPYDVCLLINVGCAVRDLLSMFVTSFNYIESGGFVIATLPANLNTLFLRDGMDEDTVREECNGILRKTRDPYALSKLPHVFRATIVEENGEYHVAEPDEVIADAKEIARKLAGINGGCGVVVPNFYHTSDAYKVAEAKAGLALDELFESKFSSEEERLTWNAQVPKTDRLGPHTVSRSVFEIHVLRKP